MVIKIVIKLRRENASFSDLLLTTDDCDLKANIREFYWQGNFGTFLIYVFSVVQANKFKFLSSDKLENV